MNTPTRVVLVEDNEGLREALMGLLAAEEDLTPVAQTDELHEVVELCRQHAAHAVVLDMEAALAEGADLVHSDKGTNKSYTWIVDSQAAGSGVSRS